jgi:hypothetical protein
MSFRTVSAIGADPLAKRLALLWCEFRARRSPPRCVGVHIAESSSQVTPGSKDLVLGGRSGRVHYIETLDGSFVHHIGEDNPFRDIQGLMFSVSASVSPSSTVGLKWGGTPLVAMWAHPCAAIG